MDKKEGVNFKEIFSDISLVTIYLIRKMNNITTRKQIEDIAEVLGIENILCQLAEESSELSQACLKYRRTLNGLTPKTKEEVIDNLIEEMADVLLNIEQIYYLLGNDIKPKIENIQNFKGSRWYRRTFITNNRPELE